MTNETRRTRGRNPDARFARLLVTDGQLACPRRGRVDIVQCFICPLSGGLSGEHVERVLCAASSFVPTPST
jgi:hypothetical protein